HHARSTNEDFAVIGDAHLYIAQGPADRANTVTTGHIVCDYWRCLCQAVALKHGHAHRREEFGQFARKRGAARGKYTDTASKACETSSGRAKYAKGTPRNR